MEVKVMRNVLEMNDAVAAKNEELLSWLNEELVQLGEEKFFHKDYEWTLKLVYGKAAKPEELVVEGGAL